MEPRRAPPAKPPVNPERRAADEERVRSWVFRNRLRLEALLGRANPPPAPRGARPTREVVLVPVRPRGERGR